MSDQSVQELAKIPTPGSRSSQVDVRSISSRTFGHDAITKSMSQVDVRSISSRTPDRLPLTIRLSQVDVRSISSRTVLLTIH